LVVHARFIQVLKDSQVTSMERPCDLGQAY
jgi:hypothetical protein